MVVPDGPAPSSAAGRTCLPEDIPFAVLAKIDLPVLKLNCWSRPSYYCYLVLTCTA